MNLFSVLVGILFISGFIGYGIFFLVGTWQKWPSFHRHCDYWWKGIFSIIEKVFGREGILIFNYTYGMLCIMLGLVGLVNGVKDLLSP